MGKSARTIVILGVILTLVLASVSTLVAEEGLFIQSSDLSDFPEVSLRVALPTELVPARAGDPEPEFSIRENSVAVAAVEGFSEAEFKQPVDVVLVIDVSGSMSGQPLADAKAAAQGFIDSVAEQDNIAIVAFASEPEVITSFTTDREELRNAVASLEARGETALYDAIVRSLDLITSEAEGEESYVIVLSDGGDTTSINSLDTASTAVTEAGVPLYAVALESPEYDPDPLRALAQRSGGKTVSVAESDAFTDIFEDIALELRNIYTVSFTSLEPATPDLDLELIVSRGDTQRSTRVALDNPLFDSDDPLTIAATGWTAGQTSPFWRLLSTMFVFAAGGLFVFAIGSILAKPSTTIDQLEYYTHEMGGPLVADKGGPGSGGMRVRVTEALTDLVGTRGFTGAVQVKLERAGLPLRPNEYMFFHLLGVIFFGLMAYLTTRQLFVGAIMVIVATLLPMILLEQVIARRRRRFENQLPDILSLVAGSLRSGWGISQSIDLVVEEVGEPAASEFRRAQSENRLGLPLEDALARMAERIDSDDFRWAVVAIAIQRDVGGNLAEVLDTVAGTIRERAELRRQVQALTAESRFSALVLVLLPFFLLVALYLINPGYLSIMFSTSMGLVVLAVGLLLLVIGSWWLMRLTKLEV